ADRNRSHWSTSKTPSYTKSVSWQHHRMRIELKEPNGKAPTKEQIAWMRRLREEGYYVVLAYGAEQAITAILEYISLKKGEAIEHVLNGDKWLYAA
ncbi:hypothetical protein ABN281_24910, partial [Escherichia coli]